MEKKLDRRTFLKLGAGAGAAAFLAACAPTATEAPPAQTGGEEATAVPTSTPRPPTPEPTPIPTAPPKQIGEGANEIVVWYQDWDGANRIMNFVTPLFVEDYPDVSVNLQAIGYTDLFNKMLPAIASGTEGDVMMMYTDWVVGTDVRQVFLDITEPAGGLAYWQEMIFPAAFTAIDVPEGKVFYLPWLAGIRGGAMTVNMDHCEEAGIDYLNFGSFEEVVEAGKAMTQRTADGKISRSGYSPRSSQYQLLWSLIWQLGGNMFDKETGVWSHATDEGEAAAQIIYDLYWKEEVCDFELFTSEYEAVSQQLVSIWGDGAWTMSAQTDVAGVACDNIVTPFLANAVEQVLYPQHAAGWGLSRRLSDDADKLDAALAYALLIVGADACLQALDFYSGVMMSKPLYDDPRIEEVKFGIPSKRVALGMWPVARYTQDHVANQAPAAEEFDLAMRNEKSIPEALAAMDAYLQEQEDEARERIGM